MVRTGGIGEIWVMGPWIGPRFFSLTPRVARCRLIEGMHKLLAVFLLPAALAAAILPETIGDYHRTATSKPALNDRPLWHEYGLKEAETAAYLNGDSRFSVTAYRLTDSTAALGVFDWQRPAQAAASKGAAPAAETADSLMLLQGNYVLFCQGHKPSAEELAALTGAGATWIPPPCRTCPAICRRIL